MVYQHKIVIVIFAIILQAHDVFGQVTGLGVEQALRYDASSPFPTSLPYSSEHLELLRQHEIAIKYVTKDWIYFNVSQEFLNSVRDDLRFKDLYFEFAPGQLLDDSARVAHSADDAHLGSAPLPKGFTGKDVIIGIVDAGLDHNHPDFIDAAGNKRVIRYWDHAFANPTQVPSPYNYGQIWYQDDITNGTITSLETSVGHGTTVTGIATGNGLANGKNKGFAPESDIIVVRSNFNLPNWTMTIADACDYIFRVADSLGKPAVVNLSLGTYLGSHDGRDPAGQAIDALLEAKEGRLVVCAAGNAGNVDWFHVQNTVTIDTSFVWFRNNPNGSLGANTIFFDLWTDAVNANFNYSFGANLNVGSYAERGATIFRTTSVGLGSEIKDTIWNSQGQRLATVRIFPKIVGQNFHLQVLFNNVDSTLYNYSFKTFGFGNYDLWSGAFIGFNQIVKEVPDVASFPPIVHYAHPDSLQTIVSSWNCSEKVISVGNLKGRFSYIDRNGNLQVTSDPATLPGVIAPSSSRGPTRVGSVKPDISSAGEFTLAAGPATILNNPSSFHQVDEGGFHMRNGGTSMASPTVAGSAALFFEKCPKATFNDFITSVINTAEADIHTGNLPNLSYGHGKLNVFDLLVDRLIPLNIYGDTLLCQGPQIVTANPSVDYYFWSTGENTSTVTIENPGGVYLIGENTFGCRGYSDTLNFSVGQVPPTPVITPMGTSLVSSAGPNYQWYRNDVMLPGETNQVLFPQSVGFYSVAFSSPDGCSSFSNAFQWTLSLEEVRHSELKLYPNPASDELHIDLPADIAIDRIEILNDLGQVIYSSVSKQKSIDVSLFAPGSYVIQIITSETIHTSRFQKL
jgi:subtilisin family serine protease